MNELVDLPVGDPIRLKQVGPPLRREPPLSPRERLDGLGAGEDC